MPRGYTSYPLRRTRVFPWLTSTDPHDCISKSKTSHPYILQTLWIMGSIQGSQRRVLNCFYAIGQLDDWTLDVLVIFLCVNGKMMDDII